MQKPCEHCGQVHLLNDDVLAKHAKVQFRCTRCGKVTVVELKKRVDETVVISPMPDFARANASTSGLQLPAMDDGLVLPEDVDIVLTVETGLSVGEFVLNQARVVIGRTGADLALNDPEISRHHCLIEVRGNNVSLKDLDSTNGTFFDEERVRAAVLLDGAAFRVGTSVIRLSFRPKPQAG